MATLHQAIWTNLLQISSALQASGLVSEFNGVLRSNDSTFFEIGSNKRIEGYQTDEPKTSHWDTVHNGFYQLSEYAEMDRSRDYSIKFLDGGLVQYFCRIDNNTIVRQRLCFYQCPTIRSYDSTPHEYDAWVDNAVDADEEARILFGYEDLEYRDVASLRIEFAPDQYRSILHPQTHLHMNSVEGCRIPVTAPIGVAAFLRFVVKNFYSSAWLRTEERIRDQIQTKFDSTIDSVEATHLHFAVPEGA